MLGRGTWIALAAGAVALAFWAGQQTSPTPAPATEREAPAAASARPIVIERTQAEPGLDREELRAIVREELARGQAAPSPAEESAEADPARQQARAEALAQASTVVEHGIADGVWSTEERNALRAQLPQLGEREIHAVLSPLFQAINAQRLQLDGPPI